MAIVVSIVELRSDYYISISGTKDENIAQNVNEMVEDILEVIKKRVAIFFVEEQKQRKELMNELALLRKDNLKLRDNLNDLKSLFSCQDKFVKSSSMLVYLVQKCNGASCICIFNHIIDIFNHIIWLVYAYRDFCPMVR